MISFLQFRVLMYSRIGRSQSPPSPGIIIKPAYTHMGNIRTSKMVKLNWFFAFRATFNLVTITLIINLDEDLTMAAGPLDSK